MSFKQLLPTLAITLAIVLPASAQLKFSEIVIDPEGHGDDKAIADIDNDGVKDVILGGATLSWYRLENGKYVKYNIMDPNIEFTTDMQVGDVDNDGDIDFFVADGNKENNVMWLENPLPDKSPTLGEAWTIHIIGTHGNWMHNSAAGDINMDRNVDLVSSGHGFTRIWFNKGHDTWQEVNLSEFGGGAVDLYDMDGDGDLDLLTIKGWIECPADAFVKEDWKFHPVEGLGETVIAGDLDLDGKPEILSCDSAHKEGKLYMLTMPADPYDAHWSKKEINPEVGSHKLQIADFNRDGHPDIMYGLELKELGILFQDPAKPGSFTKEIIAPYGGHNAIAGDLDNDGDLDIVSCDFLRHPPLRIFINEQAGNKYGKTKPLSIHRWHYQPITSKAMRTFGLAFGEVTGDNKKDIVSGSYVYENPGSGNKQEWTQYLIGQDLHAVATLDVDGDHHDEIIATKGDGTVYWCKGSKASWTINIVGKLPKASHPIGSQGHITGQIIPGGKPEVIMTAGDGTFAFQVPDNLYSPWPMIHISAHTSDEDLDVADFNGDGWNDVAGTYGETHEVFWFENPKGFKDNWKEHRAGIVNTENYLDRCVAGDFNGDHRPDIAITEETQHGPASTLIYFQPASTNDPWTTRTLVTQYTTNSMDMADVDQDGDLDILTGEHRGEKRLTLWRNDGKGNFTPFIIDRGKENHDGAKFVDLDDDGDLDIVGIGYDAFSIIHVWWNDAIVK